jgi:putative sterol carrier protein
MAFLFPSNAWLQALKDKLNSDEKYTRVAHKWEGDIMFRIEAGGALGETVYFYSDLWHGKCRDAYVIQPEQIQSFKPAYTLAASYDHFVSLLEGKLDPMQAMITRKLKVQGSMAYMMRNVPVVLDFVRCAQEIDTEFLE